MPADPFVAFGKVLATLDIKPKIDVAEREKDLRSKWGKLFQAIEQLDQMAKSKSPRLSVITEGEVVDSQTGNIRFATGAVYDDKHGSKLEIYLYQDEALTSRAGMPLMDDEDHRFAVADVDRLVSTVARFIAKSLESLTR